MNTTRLSQAQDPSAFSDQIRDMFGAIAPRYDLLNRVLSLGLDRFWRKRAVDALNPLSGQRILDVATGTADVAIEVARRNDQNHIRVTGVDFCEPMLELGRNKIKRENLEPVITLQAGSAESLPFTEASFDGVTIAFGVRNLENIQQGLREMWRVLKPGGKVVILEFALPRNALLGFVYRIYFDHILPRIGRTVSRHPDAYRYLPDSVGRFPVRADFAEMMTRSGFRQISFTDLTFGIVTIYTGIREESQE